MTKALELAKRYFQLSNESNMDEIEKLFCDSTTYSSQNTGIYLGTADIIGMQKSYHGSFANLEWKINTVEEVKPGIVLFDFDFEGTKKDGENIVLSGYEYVVVSEGFIQHIEIRNKP